MDVGGVAEDVDDLEGRRLLALDAVGVDGVDEVDGVGLGELPAQGEAVVEVPVDLERVAPWATAWLIFPGAILPAGTSTAHVRPAFVAYAAAEAEVLPVDAQITAFAPCAFAFVIAIVIPRSLNDPVGLRPSYLTHTSAPVIALSFSARMSGVPPSEGDRRDVGGDVEQAAVFVDDAPATGGGGTGCSSRGSGPSSRSLALRPDDGGDCAHHVEVAEAVDRA